MLLKQNFVGSPNKIKNYYLGIGCLCLTVSILLGRFIDLALIDFLSGMLCGMSVVFNILGLYLMGKFHREQNSQS